MPTGLVSRKIEAPRRVQPFRKKGLDIFEALRPACYAGDHKAEKMETNFLGNFLAERQIIGISLCEKERRLMERQEGKLRRCDEKFEDQAGVRVCRPAPRPARAEGVGWSLGGS